MTFYWHEQQLAEAGVQPSVLAIGDSWFWYPLPGGSLLGALAPVMARRSRTIFAVGHNGAEAVDYIDGKYRKEVQRALALFGDGLTEVLISGGGNDFAGFNDLRPLLRGDNRDAVSPADCFLPGVEWPSLGWLLGVVQSSLQRLIGQVLDKAPRAVVYLHNYDYAYPDGRGALGSEGWIRPALERTQVPVALQRGCVIHVIDRLTEMLQAVAAGFGDRVVAIDSRGTLGPTHWADEMHPTREGFAKLVADRWLPELARRGAAAALAR